jgi:mono/diheme cytochrome c family protein
MEGAAMTFPCIRTAVTGLALLMIGTGSALAVMTSSAAADGKTLLQAHCSRCHSIEAPGTSPLEQAPPLREVYLKYPIDQLEEGFAEGMASRHRDMPRIQFSSDQVSAILSYLGSITGVDPATGPRHPVPNETPP